ncbi:malonyl-ACP O-methyltransferase BioC [Candidatus Pristimantibacillus sp. PTI5]|uniref:malonyl-ACP O-methyltransferase BioC n=1 Tax=Candidatus Pristimantibacillus sp. PTI5 TaxID=3400422 RepID=UPI003B027900
MNIRTAAIQRQFNRSSAGSYDAHALVQRNMANRLAESLQEGEFGVGKDWSDILEIGCGTGALTERLVNDWSAASITALDIAPAMIKAAEQRLLMNTPNQSGNSQVAPIRVSFLQADVETWAPDAPRASFDLIVSSACFQWLSDPKQTLGHLRRMLRAGGMLVFATFGPDTFHELHTSFDDAYLATGMQPQRHGLSFRPAEQWDSLLRETGFSNLRYEHSIQTEKYDSVRDFLFSVKAMGASASEAVSKSGLNSRRLFANMYKAYEEQFGLDGGIAASYELLFIHALADK